MITIRIFALLLASLLLSGCVSGVFYLAPHSRKPQWLATVSPHYSPSEIRFTIHEEATTPDGRVNCRLGFSNRLPIKLNGTWRWIEGQSAPRHPGDVGRFTTTFRGITETYEYSWRSNEITIR
jgi:hypothetical protein